MRHPPLHGISLRSKVTALLKWQGECVCVCESEGETGCLMYCVCMSGCSRGRLCMELSVCVRGVCEPYGMNVVHIKSRVPHRTWPTMIAAMSIIKRMCTYVR